MQDLITEVARFPALGVIAAESVFAAGSRDSMMRGWGAG